jgi:hypothetical protein
MTNYACPEVAQAWPFIVQPVERILATHEGLSVDDLNWTPLDTETNSVHVLAVHVIANVREAIFQVILGQDVGRNRDSEFSSIANGSNSPVPTWPAQKAELEAALGTLTCDQLDATYEHPRRGPRTGREIFLMTATHANEHVGHAELSRQLLLASKH